MNIVFHEAFYRVYERDPAAAAGRLEAVVTELRKHAHYRFVEPVPAADEDLLRAHSALHVDTVRISRGVYDMAALAAGGAITAAELAFAGEPTFGCIRPPGHHASAASCWGFCFFNNMAVSLLKLLSRGTITSALVLDFDLHYGDGNVNILGNEEGVRIMNPDGRDQKEYLQEVASALETAGDYDIIAASAGFDEYVKDWGGKLSTEAYREIGRLMKVFSEKHCRGRRYALLEGGYYHPDLGINVHAFCEGFR